jgi:tRNA-2-methylthio-N6-dimethylallyladenosine synthase
VISQAMVGSVQRVLVEGTSRKDVHELAGAHRQQPGRQFRG